MLKPPDQASFAPVAGLLVHRCGTLDCHGAAARNLKIGLIRAETNPPGLHVPVALPGVQIDLTEARAARAAEPGRNIPLSVRCVSRAPA